MALFLFPRLHVRRMHNFSIYHSSLSSDLCLNLSTKFCWFAVECITDNESHFRVSLQKRWSLCDPFLLFVYSYVMNWGGHCQKTTGESAATDLWWAGQKEMPSLHASEKVKGYYLLTGIPQAPEDPKDHCLPASNVTGVFTEVSRQDFSHSLTTTHFADFHFSNFGKVQNKHFLRALTEILQGR